MMEQTNELLEELRKIRLDINTIKNNLVDPDTILTPEEESLLEESYENEEKGELLSSNELKRELGL